MTSTTLELKGWGRHRLTELTAKAKRLGMTPESYVKLLVDEDLAISKEARTKTFAQLLPPQEVDEEELDRIIDQARTRHHERTAKKKRR